MKQKSLGPRTQGWTSEQALLRDLNAFHSMVRSENITIPFLETLASAGLRDSDWNPFYEAAWSLLFTWMTQDPEERSIDDVGPEKILEMLPSFGLFHDYLLSFPPGDSLLNLRVSRAARFRRWYPHIHPGWTVLERYARAGQLPEVSSFDGIQRHLYGPYCCIDCRRALETMASHVGGGHEALAAATPDEYGRAWLVRVQAQDWLFRVYDDDGYLRVFVDAPEGNSSVESCFRIIFFSSGGEATAGVIQYPDNTGMGTNLGQIGEYGIGGLMGFWVERISADY